MAASDSIAWRNAFAITFALLWCGVNSLPVIDQWAEGAAVNPAQQETLASAFSSAEVSGSSAGALDNYNLLRASLVQHGTAATVGSSMLSVAERAADIVIRAAKQQQLMRTPPLSALHFFDAKSEIEGSRLFGLLRGMPKGAVLHVHADGIVPLDWVIANATYDDNAHICQMKSSMQIRYFSPQLPIPQSTPACDTGWQALSALRQRIGAAAVDAQLLQQMSLINTEPPYYASLNVVWAKFESLFGAASGILFYEPVHARYVREALQIYKADAVQHVEVRQVLQRGIGQVYTLNGTLLPVEHTLRTWQRTADELGVTVRIIVCGVRSSTPQVIQEGIDLTERLMTAFPELVSGFDLVGQEDPGRPLSAFVPRLLQAPQTMRYFFHAGETNDAGGEADMNLYDSIALGTDRIGHGYGLVRHPDLRKLVREKGIGIEVCPISNQVLMLVADLRNHPLVSFIAEGLPLTISPDDPALWGAYGASFDWFQAFVASGNTTGLDTLKQLAINSIRYSSLSHEKKGPALATWEQKWDTYVNWLANQ